ncbi:hypothetical protein GUITHDRAFT_114657 [Guillardia theta CCMP2712]|uniref:Uncharacterized protein n=1 Tax=Guillardia theta (strain CCMP2712) TaxID=905079 RepID=L1ISZ2_GUITC|nr:hypothetical protein GUITHDRAFT_114657 [Guillardia theta CCMP2712]EKX39222.1 hypothetical protein GUITHDRAFT_114657 [Guillardia theta CCMP2712]|eukprot:XP_005826202.1 hypothetical protein GUITHDRAFT_114657 [Guillardia theta CCMP2712]
MPRPPLMATIASAHRLRSANFVQFQGDYVEEAEYCSDCSRLRLPWDIPEEEEPEHKEEELDDYINDPNRTKHYLDYMFAVEQGKLDADELHKQWLNAIDQELWESAVAGDARQVEKLLQQGANASSMAGLAGTFPLLHAAAGMGHVEVVETLVRQGGARVEAHDGEGWTPLHIAADRGHLGVVKKLHELGADVNARVALVNGSQADMLYQDKVPFEWNEGAIHWCAKSEHPEMAVTMIDCLADLGADMNLRTSDNRTAIHWAIEHNCIPIVKKLVERGADVNARCCYRWDALNMAARAGNLKMVETLLALNADVYSRSPNLRSPLWWAESNHFDDVADVLRKYGIVDRKPMAEIMRNY